MTTVVGAQPPGATSGMTVDADLALRRVQADPRLTQTWELVQSPGVLALSLDVFDTLLWRTVPEPAQAFVLLGRRLLDRSLLPTRMSATTFARLRVQAERRARAAAQVARASVECHLEEIWYELRRVADLASLEAYVEAEVALERDVCHPDLGVAALAQLTGQVLGKQLRLVSDTYFSSLQLRGLLDRPLLAGVEWSDIACSSEYGVNKSGGLFDVSLASSGLDPLSVVHLGDNEVADVQGAADAGAVGVHYEKGDEALHTAMRGEHALGVALGDPRAVHERTGDAGLVALRARAARLTEGARQSEPLRPFFTTGATVFGPAFTGFGTWVHERAAQYGARRVLCLMREGEFLDRLLTAAAPYVPIPVASEPVWLSRQVCALASLTTGGREEIEAFLVRRKPSSVAGLLAQVGVDAALLPSLQDVSGAPLDAPDVAGRVLDALDDVPQARAQIVATAHRVRSQLYDHLDRHLPAEGPVVVVDVGWGGTIQTLLSRLLEQRGTPRQVVGLYLVTQAVAEARLLDGLVLEGYLASGGEPAVLLDPVLRTPEILEQVTMADAGTLVGFHADGSARTADQRMPRWQVAQKDAVQAGILAFQRLWHEQRSAGEQPLQLDGHPRLLMLAALRRLLTRPSVEEALAFGGWLHDDNFGDDAVSPVLDARTLERARHSSPAGLARLGMRDGFWPVGAARLVDPGLAALAGLAAEGEVDPELASAPSELGDVTVYVDTGQDFANGTKQVVTPQSGPHGRALVRSGQLVRRAERVRIDLAPRHGLVRVDRLAVTVHTTSRREPYVLELGLGDLEGEGRLLSGARWLQLGVFEVDSDDPFYALDLRALLAPAVARANLVEVEVAVAVLPLPVGELAVPATVVEVPVEVRVEVPVEVPVPVAVPTPSLLERAARKGLRAARSRGRH